MSARRGRPDTTATGDGALLAGRDVIAAVVRRAADHVTADAPAAVSYTHLTLPTILRV